jgi:folate-binding protein YgfZ
MWSLTGASADRKPDDLPRHGWQMLNELYKQERVPLEETFGKEYPSYFLHPAAEYRALVRSCGVIDLTHWSILRVQGKDRASFLNAMLTNDVASLDTHHGCHSMMTTVKGKIISELFVFARAREHTLVVSQGDFEETVNVLKKHIIHEDVTVDDVSHEYGILGVEGPKAKEIIHRLLGTGRLPKSPFDWVEREFESFSIVVVRNTVSGEPGYHVMVPAREVLRIRNYLVQAARGSDGLPVGRTAWNIRRVENGLPWFGIDFSGDNFPQESRLGYAVSYTKGCFRGQETLARLERRGHVNRVLVGLVPEENALSEDVWERLGRMLEFSALAGGDALSQHAAHDAKILNLRDVFPAGSAVCPPNESKTRDDSHEEKPAGWITSAVYSFALQKPLFMAYVRGEWLETTRSFRADAPRGGVAASETALPVRPPAKDT